MALERYELWRSPDGGSDSFFAASAYTDAQKRDHLEPGSQLIWTTEAESWNKAQQKRYDFMGWGHYRTWEEDEAEMKEMPGHPQKRLTPLKAKPRGMRRKCRNMVRAIESCTAKLPSPEDQYWHFHLPVDRSFLNSIATPVSVRRLCVQTLIDQASRLARDCSVPSRVVVAITLPELSDSQIIIFWREDYFQNFFERDQEDQIWILIGEESFAHRWSLRLPDGFSERGFTELTPNGKIVRRGFIGRKFTVGQVWFFGQIEDETLAPR